MKVDEYKEYNLINLAQLKKNARMIETDHNGLVVEMELDEGKSKPIREELFNLRNKACQEAFYQETEEN
jgi:hypothetical protein